MHKVPCQVGLYHYSMGRPYIVYWVERATAGSPQPMAIQIVGWARG